MASTVLSFRTDDELAAWATEYAAKRKVKRGAILEAALREFREACEGGVPDLPEPKPVGRPRSSSATSPARPVRVDTVSQAHQWALNRQALLNKAKDRSK